MESVTYLTTIQSKDVGKSTIHKKDGSPVYLQNVIGHIQEIDIGKRVYLVEGIVQVESNEQLERRS